MSRDILFRGKSPYGNHWAEGSLIVAKNFCCILDNGAPDDMDYPYLGGELGWIDGRATPVIPETVGQYTGLTDENGKKIFDGDILKIARVSDSIGSYYFPPLVYPVNVIVKWDMCAWMWETLCKDKRYIGFPDAWCHYKCEVIGNIHDNHELLEVQR